MLGKLTTSWSGGSKRRHPGGTGIGTGSNAKTRRREDSMGGKERRGDRERDGEGKGRKDKEELVDGALVDQLRREFGDPLKLTRGGNCA